MRLFKLLFTLVLLLAHQVLWAQSSLCALVLQEGKPLPQAKVYLVDEFGMQSFHLTDSTGLVIINGLSAGSYDLKIGHQDITGIQSFNELLMPAGIFKLETFEIGAGDASYVMEDGKWEKIKEEPDSYDPVAAPMEESVLFETLTGAPVVASKAKKRGGKDKSVPSTFDIDAAEYVVTESEEMPVESIVPTDDPSSNNDIQAGTLTASEWNDLANWDLWSDQVEEEFADFTNIWSFKPINRQTILLTDENGLPLVHAFIELIGEDGTRLSAGRTDNKGIAELFLKTANSNRFDCRITYHGMPFEFSNIKAKENLEIQVNTTCLTNDVVDIMFVVDATGSMGDEINYLKKEVEDVIDRVGKLDDQKTIRSGAIFYRDHQDQYLSRRKALSTDLTALNTFVQDQRAGGGGDFPEALDVALEELTTSINWSKNAMAKIAFIILDAPPHQDSASIERVNRSVLKAAELGIRLIPITGSGIDKSTEYLMKALAIQTNGTYLYLTDDSGVGGKHLDASNDKTEVLPLNDLMVKVVDSMIEVACFEPNEEIDITATETNTQLDGVKLFPNPMVDVLNIDVAFDVDQAQIFDLTGQLMLDLGMLKAGLRQIDVSRLKSGNYLIVFRTGDQMNSLKLISVNEY